ncbi:MAG TPA: glycosyltransferase, partial [Bdellovibrio sp.]|nr:glycosyltransferase [Bdellovibrio sp.]
KGFFAKRRYKNALVAGFRQALQELGTVDLVIDFIPVLNRFLSSFKDYRMILWMHAQKSHMPKWERFKYFLRMRKYEQIVLISEEMKAQFIGYFPSIRDKFTVIYNPFDFDRINKLAIDESELSEADRALMQKDYVVSVGRLVPAKDFATIVEAAKILKDRGMTYTHYFLGAGEFRNALQKQIDAYGLSQHVLLLGQKNNPYIWLKRAKFFVHSALREGLPTVVIESMILARPVIASACPVGPREILENGKCGALYDVGDAQGLANQIERLLKDEKLGETFVQKASERVQIFHSSKVLPKFYNYIDTLLEKP